MRNRTLIGIAITAVFVLLTIFRKWLMPVFIMAAGIMCYIEVHKALKAGGMTPTLWTGIVMIVGMQPTYWLWGLRGTLVLYMIMASVNLVWAVFVPRRKFTDVMASTFLMFYPVWGFMSLMLINETRPEALATVGVALALFAASASDVGALFIGKFFGKHKLAPLVSPNKTVEGCIGGAAACLFSTVGIGQIVIKTGYYTGLGWWEYLFMGVLIASFTQIGDLTASMIKRQMGIKDFSRVLGNHGGLMDRLDGVLMACLAVTCMMSLFRLI